MSNAPNSDPQPENNGSENDPQPEKNWPQNDQGQNDRGQGRRLWRSRLMRAFLATGAIAVAGVGVGAAWLWFFVHNELTPLVEKELSKLVSRPVMLGPVEQFSLTGLRLGRSFLPATGTDPDFAIVPEAIVRYDPMQLIATRVLSLEIILISPEIYAEQDERGAWLQIQIKSQENQSPGPIQIQLDTIRIRNASLVLAPRELEGGRGRGEGSREQGSREQQTSPAPSSPLPVRDWRVDSGTRSCDKNTCSR